MSRSSVSAAAALALVLALSASSLAAAQDGEPADPVENPNTGDVSDALIPQDGSLAVYEEHIRALNECDWLGLMAQYPNDAEIHLSDGEVVKGRQALGELFAGFVADPADGGLCGLTFTEESRFEVGDTQNVQWVAEAGFLAEPYRGSDAYVSDGQYMVAQLTTFEGTDLAMAEVEVMDDADAMEEEVADEMDVSAEEAAALDEMDADEEAIAEEIMEDEE